MCERVNIYEEAIKTFGMQHQEWKIVEELAELSLEIVKCKDRPDRCNFTAIITEMADVYIMLEQLLVMLRINGVDHASALVEYEKSEKLKRLKALIKEEKAKQE